MINQLTKTTINFAKRHGFDLDVVGSDNYEFDNRIVWIYELDDDSEPMFAYWMNDDGTFSWRGNVYLAQSIKKELPTYIKDEKGFRDMLKFVSDELKK